MANSVSVGESRGFGATGRRDTWWGQPLTIFAVLLVFVLYSNWAAMFQGADPTQKVAWNPDETAAETFGGETYLSPFYSPAWVFQLGKNAGLPFPIFAILWIPLGFRLTCYFARRTYYRGFKLDPPACAVSEFPKNYSGESKFPLIFQNLHRYFLYFAIGLVAFHWVDIFHAFRKVNGDGSHSLYIGLGSFVLLADAALLTLYVFSCHSMRHLIGGGLNCFTCKGGSERPRHKLWKLASKANEYHGLYFWLSLFAVWFADVYVRFLAQRWG